jgi:hypothetical protein
MRELSLSELMEVDGGIAKLPWWVKGSLWGFIAYEIVQNWADIKSGIVDGWADAMKE